MKLLTSALLIAAAAFACGGGETVPEERLLTIPVTGGELMGARLHPGVGVERSAMDEQNDGAANRLIDGGGHAVYKTNPSEFHEAFLGFVQSLR